MEGTIFDIKRYAIHDGPGIRTTVFLKGCVLHCPWCHNPEGLSSESTSMERSYALGNNCHRFIESVGYRIEAAELVNKLCRDTIFFDESGGGVTFSGGEPLLQPDFLLECLALCKQYGLHTCVDTAGAAEVEKLEEIAAETDLFLYDLKIMDRKRFEKYIGTGFDNVISNFSRIAATDSDIVVRIPCIPGFNMLESEMCAIADFLDAFPNVRSIELLPFHTTGKNKYQRLGMEYGMKRIENISTEDLTGIRKMFESNGFLVK